MEHLTPLLSAPEPTDVAYFVMTDAPLLAQVSCVQEMADKLDHPIDMIFSIDGIAFKQVIVPERRKIARAVPS